MDRILGPNVVVLDDRDQVRGCGFLVGGPIILTSGYVIGDQSELSVWLLGTGTKYACDVVHKSGPVGAAVLRIREGIPANLTTAPIPFGQLRENESPRDASLVCFPPSMQSMGPTPLRVNGTLDPVATPGSYSFHANTPLVDDGVGCGGAAVICDGRVMGLVMQRMVNEPLLIVHSMKQILRAEGVSGTS
jgi:hypothetical protein